MKNSKSLIIYYSLTSKTEKIAQIIKEKDDCDMYSLSLIDYYMPFIGSLFKINKDKNDNDSTILQELKSLDAYESVYVGFPVWFSSLPFFMKSFLSEFDLKNKEIKIFMTAGNSEMHDITEKLTSFFSQESVAKALLINNSNKHTPREELVNIWFEAIN